MKKVALIASMALLVATATPIPGQTAEYSGEGGFGACCVGLLWGPAMGYGMNSPNYEPSVLDWLSIIFPIRIVTAIQAFQGKSLEDNMTGSNAMAEASEMAEEASESMEEASE